MGFCSLQWPPERGSIAADGFHPGPTGYARWSSAMAQKVAEVVGRG
jgi:lysophospholipase L1-like esterase